MFLRALLFLLMFRREQAQEPILVFSLPTFLRSHYSVEEAVAVVLVVAIEEVVVVVLMLLVSLLVYLVFVVAQAIEGVLVSVASNLDRFS
jgi:hypothetical protein